MVIPILLQGARVPPKEKLPETLSGLPGIQALPITDDWDAGVTKLVSTLDRIVEEKRSAAAGELTQVPPDGTHVAEASGPTSSRAAELADRSTGDPASPPVLIPEADPTGPKEPTGSKEPTAVPPLHPEERKGRGPAVAIVVALVILGLIAGGIVLVASTRHPAEVSGATKGEANGAVGASGASAADAADAALHDYLWNVYRLLQRSQDQRTQIRQAISNKDAQALEVLQQRRRDLLGTVQGWQVPGAARALNDALARAFRDAVIADGYWIEYANGTRSYGSASAYETNTVHVAKFDFDALYDQLRTGVEDPPPAVPSNYLF